MLRIGQRKLKLEQDMTATEEGEKCLDTIPASLIHLTVLKWCALLVNLHLGDEDTIPDDMASLLKASLGLWEEGEEE